MARGRLVTTILVACEKAAHWRPNQVKHFASFAHCSKNSLLNALFADAMLENENSCEEKSEAGCAPSGTIASVVLGS